MSKLRLLSAALMIVGATLQPMAWAQSTGALPGATTGNASGSDAQGTASTTAVPAPTLPSITNVPGAGALSPARGSEAASMDDLRQVSAPAPARTRAGLNEFQRYVAATTGRNLPMFGEDYFAGAPQTFAPVERVPVPAEYVLGPGDELYIRGWGNVDIDFRTSVDRNGQINIPKVGTFGVAGLKASDVEGYLRTQIGRVYKGFSLNVTLGQLRSIQVFVVGQALRPGTYTVSSLSTLVNAVFASGGPGPNGSMRNIQIKRAGRAVAELDLYDFIVQGDKSKDVQLQPGDTIVYGTAGPRVAVLGAVDSPAIFELKPNGSPLLEVMALAGGGRPQSNTRQAQLERVDPTNPKAPRQVLTVELLDAAQTLLRDGDVLTALPAVPKFANAVTLRGNVAAPLRYPYTPGMRVSQLIPERDALITPDYYIRKNRLVQFTETRITRPTDTEQSVRNMVDEPNWEYATVERLDADRITTKLLSFHLGKAVIDRDPEHDLQLLPGDVVTIFSGKDIRGPQSRSTRLVRIEGEVDRPGVYQLQPGDSLRSLIARAGGTTPQAYLFGIEFARESIRRKQRQAIADALGRIEASVSSATATQAANLSTTSDAAAAARLQIAQDEGRRAQLRRLRALEPNGRIALELEPAIKSVAELPDVPLEDGDAILIPSRPGFVFAVGAVANDNALLWRPGRTLKSYLAIAGVTPDADEANIFVVRADGSVVHSRDQGSIFSRSLLSLELAPGDTLVVPELLNRETTWSAFVRGAKDWTQILSNFGLAAAAIKSLNN